MNITIREIGFKEYKDFMQLNDEELVDAAKVCESFHTLRFNHPELDYEWVFEKLYDGEGYQVMETNHSDIVQSLDEVVEYYHKCIDWS